MGRRRAKRRSVTASIASSRNPFFKIREKSGDTVNMVALQAIVSAITISLVLAAARLSLELDVLDRD